MYRERALEHGLSEFTAEQRQDIYKRLKLNVCVHADQSIGLEGELPLSISYFDSPWFVTDLEVDEDGMSAMLVVQNESGWTSTSSSARGLRA